MAVDDRRIAWLLTAEAVDCGSAVTKVCLSVAAEAGFRVVAMNHSTATGGIGPAIEAEAMRLGMQCILVNDAAHCRLASRLRDAERRSLAQALSRDGFDGFILCEVCDSRTGAESLRATARALLRDLDQLDWESYH
jgi:hydroxypyruvate isomerase